jgi:enterochelin esterase family protein
MPLGGTVVIQQVPLERLKDNPLNDPWVRELPIYIPPGYEQETQRRYPVVYWLHGFTNTALTALNCSPWAPNLPQAAEAAILEDHAPPFILIMVDGFTRYGGSQFVNSSATGQYEDALVLDLVPYVDRTFRTLAGRDHRGLDGHSSGGYGALVLGMRHPDVFGGVAAHSPDAYFELCYKPDFPKLLGTLAKHGGLQGFLRAFLEMPKKTGEALGALNVAAMAMAYSPNPASPDGFDLPFDPHTGELRADVWQRWEAHDPVVLAPRHAEALRSLKLLYFECGTRDEYHLQYGARILAQRLRGAGVPHEHQEFDDGHGGISYRYRESLGRLARALADSTLR